MFDIETNNGDGFIPMPLPVLPGSIDFKNYQLLLNKMDQILIQSKIEVELGNIAVKEATEQILKQSKTELKSKKVAAKEIEILYPKNLEKLNPKKIRRKVSYAMRCNIARCLSQESYRSFSIHLSDSILLQKFCGYTTPFAPKKTPSKSQLERYENMFDEKTIRSVTDLLFNSAADVSSALHGKDGLSSPIDTEVWLLDSTCAKLDVHFPTDWVLLKDCVKSIIQTIIQIRKHGIHHRIGNPEAFLSNINKLSMQMSNDTKRTGKKKNRKLTFRKMRKVLEKIIKHGERYLEKLETEWEKTSLTEKVKNQISKKLKHTLDISPKVIHVAYERIIGERKVDVTEKILSIHEDHTQSYSRGKSGAQFEYGLQLSLGESLDGLITYWELIDGRPKNDTKHIDSVLERRNEFNSDIQPSIIVGDRGYSAKSFEHKLSENSIESCICPKNPHELKKRLGEENFSAMLKRRAQTEARIGILKNNFMGRRLITKGYENQCKQVAWAVLTHNIWVVARLPFKDILEESVA